MLSRAGAIALRALVELARDPERTLSLAELARRQELPEPMLEQILQRLRRAGLVRAQRGRRGGYQLLEAAERLSLDRVLQAVRRPPAGEPTGEEPLEGATLGASAGHRVERQLRARLELLLRRELQRLTLAELLYDQQSWEGSLGPDGGVMLL
jgi:Rrf2 family transcriptional regulator, iron-sulfur cluster assembly transcription factor